MNENNNSKRKLLKKAALETTKLSKYFADIPYLELQGNREVKIEGCKGVLSYDESCIRINTSGIIICFKGRGLRLKSLSPSCLIIEGFITCVEFDS